MLTPERQHQCLTDNALPDWKPVQALHDRANVILPAAPVVVRWQSPGVRL